MATWQIVVAVIAALIGGGLVWWRNSVLKDVRLMLATETTPTGAIAGKAAGTLVEIKGTITSSEPLEAEFSKKSCVWHRSVIEEEYRKPSSGPDRSSETSRREVHNSTRFSRASVDDGSGPVAINLGSATFEGIEVVNTFDKAGGGVSISLGPLTIGDNTIGHHKREEVVPVGHAIYVLATAARAVASVSTLRSQSVHRQRQFRRGAHRRKPPHRQVAVPHRPRDLCHRSTLLIVPSFF